MTELERLCGAAAGAVLGTLFVSIVFMIVEEKVVEWRKRRDVKKWWKK